MSAQILTYISVEQYNLFLKGRSSIAASVSKSFEVDGKVENFLMTLLVHPEDIKEIEPKGGLLIYYLLKSEEPNRK